MDVLAGTPVTVWADFLSATDDLVVPATGSVIFSLHNGAGVRILGPELLTPEPGATGVAVPLSDTDNTLPPERLFDARTIVVSWLTDDATSGQTRVRYRVVPFPIYDVTPQMVRDVIGIASDELPDAAIDVFTGYLRAAGALGVAGKAVLDAALISGDQAALTANRIVAYTVVQGLMPSLPQRVLQSKTDGTLKTDRLKSLNLDALASAIETQLALDMGELQGITSDQLQTPVLMVLTSPTTDPVTGNAPDTGT